MLIIFDLLEPLIQGRWEYLGGFILGLFSLGLIRVTYMMIIERERKKDTEYIQAHQNIPVAKLQSISYKILATIIVLIFIVMPGVLWVTVEILKSIESIDPGIAVLFVFIVMIMNMIIIAVQGVRYKRLSRRIKLIKSNL